MWLWWLLWGLRLILLGIKWFVLSLPQPLSPRRVKGEFSFDGLVMAKLPRAMQFNVVMIAAASFYPLIFKSFFPSCLPLPLLLV
jgi:hypothetical protein